MGVSAIPANREGGRLARLVDRRLEIHARIERLKEELALIDQELKPRLEPGEILLGSDGYGFRLNVTRKYVYGEQTILALKRMDLLEPFANITTTGLQNLVKEGRLSEPLIRQFQAGAELRETRALYRYNPSTRYLKNSD